MARGDNISIIYPSGCRQVTEDLGSDELIRRLKTLAHTLQSMGQDDGSYQEYIPLAMHIADDFFLTNPSNDVQLLVACCIADILRIYAPEAPYKDPAQVKTIFMFLISQLAGLSNPNDPAFKRYFYLLENLAYVKSFNMCFEIEQCQEIFCKLFKLIFKIVNDEHSVKVKSFMLDVLCPLINESDSVSNELLMSILSNIIEPTKSQQRNACSLATELIVKCSDTLEPYIHSYFNQRLFSGKEDKEVTNSKKVYDLLYELNQISPSILLTVLPQLEFKLKSTEEDERYGSVSLLARMFSEKDSTLAVNHKQLWTAFLGRFNDISIKVRIKCVQYCMHFLINHPELRNDITQILKLRQHDSEESVRYEVVMAIVTTAKRSPSIVSDSDDLLTFVKERTLDKKFKIRKEAMNGLAMIYKLHLNSSDVPQATKRAVTWIRDKILHGYYMTSIDDRLLVERLLSTCLVPYQLPPEDRMKKLLQLYGSIDDNAGKAFIELLKHKLAVRKCSVEFLELHGKPQSEEINKEINNKVGLLSKFLPDPTKVQEYLKKFSSNLLSDSQLYNLMEMVLCPTVSCKESVETVTMILKKLGQPIMTNLYYNTIKMLLERVSNVLIDGQAIEVLLSLVEGSLEVDPNILDDLQLPSDIALEKGLKLLYVLSFIYPAHFVHKKIILQLISLLKLTNTSSSPTVLSILSNIGKYKPIGEEFPSLVPQLSAVCQEFAECGSVKMAKQSIRCLHVNIPSKAPDVFSSILDKIRENLSYESKHFRTAVASLGHIAFSMPEKFSIPIKNIVSRKIVKELLMKNQPRDHSTAIGASLDGAWADDEDDLSEEVRVKAEGLKMMARWLLGLKNDEVSAQKTFRMLNAFIVHKGDLLETGTMMRPEMAHLRLSAGAAMLKVCEQKGVGDQYTAEQFYNLALLMNDDCPQVREKFAHKLHKGLSRGIPHKCLPLDFMGFYGLAGLESDKAKKLVVRQNMLTDINKRREYIRSMTMSGAGEKVANQLPNIMPDYMLVFAIPLLAHLPEFTDVKDVDQLLKIRSCLWFILEPLITKNDAYSFGFYKTLIEEMKNHKDAAKPQDDTANTKLWAVCDLAMGLILSKSTTFEMKVFPTEPRIPPMYFKKHEDASFTNTVSYLPTELQVVVPKGSTKTLTGGLKKTRKDSESVQDKEASNKSSDPTNGVSCNRPKRGQDCDEAVAPSSKKTRVASQNNNNQILR